MQETMKRALVLVFFVGAAGLLVNFNATPGRAQEVKRNVYLPQLADLMNESMQTHHAKLWFAGHAGNGQALRFRLRSSSHVLPPVLIQFDTSASEDPSKTSSE